MAIQKRRATIVGILGVTRSAGTPSEGGAIVEKHDQHHRHDFLSGARCECTGRGRRLLCSICALTWAHLTSIHLDPAGSTQSRKQLLTTIHSKKVAGVFGWATSTPGGRAAVCKAMVQLSTAPATWRAISRQLMSMIARCCIRLFLSAAWPATLKELRPFRGQAVYTAASIHQLLRTTICRSR